MGTTTGDEDCHWLLVMPIDGLGRLWTMVTVLDGFKRLWTYGTIIDCSKQYKIRNGDESIFEQWRRGDDTSSKIKESL